MKSFFVCLIVVLLSGCFPQEITRFSDDRSYAYSGGLFDGCKTRKGTMHGVAEQNQAAYKYVSDYKEGWDKGFDACKSIPSSSR